MTEKLFKLLPSKMFTTYVRGVPAKQYLVQVQPEGARWLGAKHPPQYLEKYTAHHWILMKRAAKDDGIDLVIYSAYRSHEHQQRLFDQWQDGKRHLRPSKPGWSRHESGRAVDVLRSHDDPDGGGPEVGPTDKWLEKNARDYGFYRTVPAELWHWEFRGVGA